MKTLISMIEESNNAEDVRDMQALLVEYTEIYKTLKIMLVESEDVNALFDETSKMLAAAKRGLGISNKLKDPDSRKKNRSRIMGTLNKLRANLSRIAKAL